MYKVYWYFAVCLCHGVQRSNDEWCKKLMFSSMLLHGWCAMFFEPHMHRQPNFKVYAVLFIAPITFMAWSTHLQSSVDNRSYLWNAESRKDLSASPPVLLSMYSTCMVTFLYRSAGCQTVISLCSHAVSYRPGKYGYIVWYFAIP